MWASAPTTADTAALGFAIIYRKTSLFRWADRVVRPYRNGIIQCPCRAMRGRGLFLRYGETGYVTPHTVMDASSSRSISWENSHVFFVRSSSGIPMPEELMEP